MILGDEYLALEVLAQDLHSAPRQPVLLTYGRAYRLLRVVMAVEDGLEPRSGRFSNVVRLLAEPERSVLRERLTSGVDEALVVPDPRRFIRRAGQIQNAHRVSLLQAETLATAVELRCPVRMLDPASAPEPVVRAAQALGVDLKVA